MTENHDADSMQPDESKKAVQPRRRSSRLEAKRTAPSPEPAARPAKSIEKCLRTGTMSESRRNPKRKASEPIKAVEGPSANLLEEALKPLEPAEIEQWEGWVELESEPVSTPADLEEGKIKPRQLRKKTPELLLNLI